MRFKPVIKSRNASPLVRPFKDSVCCQNIFLIMFLNVLLVFLKLKGCEVYLPVNR